MKGLASGDRASPPPHFEQAFTVRYSEVGPRGLLRTRTLLDYLQDAAARHAALLGIGMEALRDRNLTWVLSRLRLLVERYPGPEETVAVRTWPSAREGVSAFREFEVFDDAGSIVARARSLWVLLDTEKRRPVRFGADFPRYQLLERRALQEDFTALTPPSAPATVERFTVRREDLDVNRHVNNAVYVSWALESVPSAYADARLPVDLEVAFRAEAFCGETVLARCAATADGTRLSHQLEREGDGRELARLLTRWA